MVCGFTGGIVQRCHIIPTVESLTRETLKYIPRTRLRGFWPFSPPPVIPGEISLQAWYLELLTTREGQMSISGEQGQPGASSRTRNAASQGGRGPDVSANPAPGNTRQAQLKTSRRDEAATNSTPWAGDFDL